MLFRFYVKKLPENLSLDVALANVLGLDASLISQYSSTKLWVSCVDELRKLSKGYSFRVTNEENEQKEFMELINGNEQEMTEKFIIMKEEALVKLNSLKEQSEDDSIKQKIEETIQKVQNQQFDKVSYVKLKNLKENL